MLNKNQNDQESSAIIWAPLQEAAQRYMHADWQCSSPQICMEAERQWASPTVLDPVCITETKGLPSEEVYHSISCAKHLQYKHRHFADPKCKLTLMHVESTIWSAYL